MGSVNFMFIKPWLQAKIQKKVKSQNLETKLQTDNKTGRLTERWTAELLTQHQSQLR